jgi:hypothetical protein
MLGVENLKKLVKFPLDLTKQITDSTADGWQITDLFSFVDELSTIPGIVKNWKETVAELKELDALERAELHAYVVTEFDIPNDKVEVFVENALLNVVSLIALYEQFKALKSANQ